MTSAIRRFFGRPVAGVEVGDLVFGIVLSLSATLAADGRTSNSGNPNAGPSAALVVLLMTAPVVIARRRPLLACAVLALTLMTRALLAASFSLAFGRLPRRARHAAA